MTIIPLPGTGTPLYRADMEADTPAYFEFEVDGKEYVIISNLPKEGTYTSLYVLEETNVSDASTDIKVHVP